MHLMHCSAIIVCFFMYGFDLPIVTTCNDVFLIQCAIPQFKHLLEVGEGTEMRSVKSVMEHNRVGDQIDKWERVQRWIYT